MSSNINYNLLTEKHSFFAVNLPAWHGLGQIVEDYPTSAEAIQFAGLDYRVEKRPNTQILPVGPNRTSKESFFTYRTDSMQVLGDHVGHKYKIIQNGEAFDFFDSLIGEHTGIKYETAGALGNGERIFITALLPDYIRIGNSDDVIKKYLLLSNSHDGSSALTLTPTDIRVVCGNTLNHALKDKSNTLKIKHTLNAESRLKLADKVLGFSRKSASSKQELFTHWSKTRIRDHEVKKLIRLAMTSNKETIDKIRLEQEFIQSTYMNNIVDTVFSYAMGTESQLLDTTKGTVFGAYNAVTGYFQNVKAYKSSEEKAKSILFGGDAYTKSLDCFKLCNDFARYGADALN
ncbi:DUF945 domain-containing protein [Chitinophaga sp. Ak27]|nr:DUF945 domain-containing protein [Chitinophaga sp. Ak27]